MAEGAIQEKSFSFALQIIDLYRRIVEQREFIISKQLLRSGTSIGANVEEATGAESRKDFASKLSIARKEARETKYWLRLFKESGLAGVDVSEELAGVDELLRLLTAIIKKTRQAE